MEKVRGEVFATFFGSLGENKSIFINCSINFLWKFIIFRTRIGQYKDVQFAEEISLMSHLINLSYSP